MKIDAVILKTLPEVHLKKALALEDDERYKEAADEFIKANKPKEAIDMYIHQRDWQSAMGIAEKFDREAVNEVPSELDGHGTAMFE